MIPVVLSGSSAARPASKKASSSVSVSSEAKVEVVRGLPNPSTPTPPGP
jgi:hypothetical protein